MKLFFDAVLYKKKTIHEKNIAFLAAQIPATTFFQTHVPLSLLVKIQANTAYIHSALMYPNGAASHSAHMRHHFPDLLD